MLMRALLFTVLVSGLWAEPFVYSSGSSSSKRVKRNQNAIYKLKQETVQLREEIEGLRSIIEGLNRTVGRMKSSSESAGQNKNEKKILTDIANLIDKINQEYVSKRELDRALKGLTPAKHRPVASTPKPTPHPSPKQIVKKKKAKKGLDGASSSALYSKGVRLVGKKHYGDAKLRFDILRSRGYKKAATHFYLGEIAYRTAQYTQAVDEYKQSAELNENADYMDTLLLHTGIALKKSGDVEQAKRFFQAIVDGYPESSSAKVAKKYL